jgi:prepilin-type N-terminal cleavage/methylation domain-containing protein
VGNSSAVSRADTPSFQGAHNKAKTSGFRHLAGFTLIELLVVIAVIAILAGIILAALPAVREKAQMTDKMSRYRHLYIANQMYSAENDGYICPASNGPQKWQELLSPYLDYAERGSDIFVDPMYERPSPDNPNLTGIGMGYYFLTPENWQRNVVFSDDDELKGVKLFVVEDRSYRIFMGDSVKWQLNASHADTTRHEDGQKGMFLLFDGRVELLNSQEVELGISNPAELKALRRQSGG